MLFSTARERDPRSGQCVDHFDKRMGRHAYLPDGLSVYSIAVAIHAQTGMPAAAAATLALRHVPTGSLMLIVFRVSVMINKLT